MEGGDLFRGLPDLFFTAAAKRQSDSLRGESEGYGPADAAARAGHQSDFIAKTEIHDWLVSSFEFIFNPKPVGLPGI